MQAVGLCEVVRRRPRLDGGLGILHISLRVGLCFSRKSPKIRHAQLQ